RLYSDANFEVAYSQTEDVNPIVYLVELQPLNLATVQGLQLRFWSIDSQEEDPPFHTERTLSVNTNWPADSPPVSSAAGSSKIASAAKESLDFIAEWSGILYAPRYGPYSLRLITPGPGLLELDGNVIFE